MVPLATIYIVHDTLSNAEDICWDISDGKEAIPYFTRNVQVYGANRHMQDK